MLRKEYAKRPLQINFNLTGQIAVTLVFTQQVFAYQIPYSQFLPPRTFINTPIDLSFIANIKNTL